MDFIELLFLNVTQAEGLVPAVGEDVERNLAADGERQAVVGELLPQDLDELRADARLLQGAPVSLCEGLLQGRRHAHLIKRLELVSLLDRRVTPNRAHVDHAVAELDERPPSRTHSVTGAEAAFKGHLTA